MYPYLSVREAMIAASPLTSFPPLPPPTHLQVQPGEVVSKSHGEKDDEDEEGGEGAAQPTPPSRPLTQSREVETRGAGGRGAPLPMLWSRGRPDPDNFSLLSLIIIWPLLLSSSPAPSPIISLLTISPSSFISCCNTCSTCPWSAPRTEE